MRCVYDLVVIGGGPCGIAAVVEAKANGFRNVLLLEKGDNHSQTIRKFYKDNKRVDKSYKGQDSTIHGIVAFDDGTKESTLDYFDKLLDNDEIDTAFNSEVESVKKEDGVFHITTASVGYGAKNVMISIGKMGRPNKPDYKIPPSLNSVVNFNLNSCSSGEKIIVVGGGNSAAEYAVELSEANDVTLNYRKDKFTRLNDINESAVMELANAKKLKLKLGVDIKELENESGKIKVNFTDDTSEIYDRIIYAIGGSTPVDFLQKCGVELDEDKDPIVDENYQSTIKGLYIGGDIVLKNGGSIVLALNHAHKVIQSIKNSR
ncbi:NAD(P)-binding domain-containing protein [Campylobacter sp. RM16188]|uniref:NAD(P)-binding domain-containing protein n=1 Tax=Campylobacter sp. RM16188 TaxID=1705725 RepID=UPI001553BA95|nr:NAD(P)-binding domain-containing protein [Campylobacter sp. RM16188]